MTAPNLSGRVQHLDSRQRRRLFLGTIFRIVRTTAVLIIAYCVLPIDRGGSRSSLVVLLIGTIVVAAVLGRQVQSIVEADYPHLRAIEAAATAIPLVIIVFATSYIEMAHVNVHAFSQPMTRITAIYFTITVLSTVGFGDIVPGSDYARLVVAAQMLIDLVLIGAVARLLFGAARRGVDRLDVADTDPAFPTAPTSPSPQEPPP